MQTAQGYRMHSWVVFAGVLGTMFCLAGAVALSRPQDVEARVEALIGQMTLEEKIGQMTQINDFDGKIPDTLRQQLREGRIGSMLNEVVPETSREIQRIAMEESRLGIPLIMGRDVIHGFRTIFPIPLGHAAAWDPELIKACARVAAVEASGAGFQWTFAPMMDIARDPRWGRIAESFGEDPYLASALAAAMVRGFQGEDLSAPDTIAACAKHFAAYGAAEGGRDYNTVNLSQDRLRDIYLPPFESAVRAGVVTVMTSFNEINGIPSSGNPFLLREVLRNEWSFRGFVVSDWRSMAEMIDHGFCRDLKDVAGKSIEAGVDMEMQSSAYADHLAELVRNGVVPEPLIDDAVRGILRIKFRLGLFEKPFPYSARRAEPPSEASLALARRAARESVVLLKNERQLLPLSREYRSLAVIGPLADAPYEILGTWNRDGDPEDTVTPLGALRSMIGDQSEIHYAAGLPYSRSRDTSGFDAAVEQARNSDVVLMFVGEEAILSGEAHSRAHLDLPGAQNELIARIAATAKPIVLVVLAGRPLTIGGVIEQARAVLYAWHPGTMGGPALADLIFGVESPSGKLPVTFPKTEGQIPVYYAHKSTGRPPETRHLIMIDDIPVGAYQGSVGDAARYLDIGYEPLYPFGFGLSYTKFAYSDLKLSSSEMKADGRLRVSVNVANIGPMEGVETVQLYVRDLVGSRTRPVRELKGFQKVHLKQGEVRTVFFDLPAQSLGFHNPELKYVVEPGWFDLWVGGDSRSGVQAGFDVVE